MQEYFSELLNVATKLSAHRSLTEQIKTLIILISGKFKRLIKEKLEGNITAEGAAVFSTLLSPKRCTPELWNSGTETIQKLLQSTWLHKEHLLMRSLKFF